MAISVRCAASASPKCLVSVVFSSTARTVRPTAHLTAAVIAAAIAPPAPAIAVQMRASCVLSIAHVWTDHRSIFLSTPTSAAKRCTLTGAERVAILGSMLRALAAMTLCACGVVDEAPPEPAPPLVPPVEIDPPANAPRAIAIALGFYAEQASIVAPAVTVHWTNDTIELRSGPAEGVTYGCDDIWVRVASDAKLMPLTLSHELGHCILRTIHGGNGDPQHTLVGWWGDGGLVDRAHLAVRAAGL